MASDEPLTFGCVGLGGYGRSAIAALLKEEDEESVRPQARLTAVCDPELQAHALRVEELRARGVRVYARFDELLADPTPRAVWLPVPIALHRPFMEKALAAEKAVLCEKPAAGCIDDVDAMIAARDRSGLPAAIGFQNVYQPDVQAVKRHLLDGAIGTIRQATVVACWPRDGRYYHRNHWAGAARREGRWILDSPLNNAASHLVHQTLFWLGDTPAGAARPTAVEAELYRANAIENYDTCAVRVALSNRASLLIYMTHACPAQESFIRLVGDRGTLLWEAGRPMELKTAGGVESIGNGRGASLNLMVRAFSRWAQGDGDRIVATLESARMHSLIVSGASDATTVHPVPESYVRSAHGENGDTRREIENIANLCLQCARQGVLLNESGLADWTRPAGRLSLDSYHHFSGHLLK